MAACRCWKTEYSHAFHNKAPRRMGWGETMFEHKWDRLIRHTLNRHNRSYCGNVSTWLIERLPRYSMGTAEVVDCAGCERAKRLEMSWPGPC